MTSTLKSVRDALGATDASSESAATLPRHRWYVVKEGFSPALVDAAIQYEECEEGDVILDPFCGGGTVPLAAALFGISALGIEVNPFLAFVAKTKLSRASPSRVNDRLPVMLKAIKRGARSPLDGFSTFKRTTDRPGLFNQDVLEGFEGGWRATDCLSSDVRSVIRLALIGSAMDCCNAVRDGKALRYRRSLLDANFDRRNLQEAFERRTSQALEDLALDICVTQRLWQGDSRRKLSQAGGVRFKLCFTSPPYLNSFDYSDIYRPELFLARFVRSNDELRKIRLATVRSHVQVNWRRPRRSDFGERFQDCWEDIRDRQEALWDRRIPLMIQAYFEDMRLVFHKLRRLAAPGASVWLVVSTSAYAGVEIPVDLILADVGVQVGWHLREVCVLRHMRSSGQYWRSRGIHGSKQRKLPPLRESVIIFDSEPST